MAVNKKETHAGPYLFSVRNRLLLLVLLAIIVPVVVTQYISVATLQNALKKDIDQTVYNLASSETRALSETLSLQVELLNAQAHNSVILFAIESQARQYAEYPDIQGALAADDETWLAAAAADDNAAPLIASRISNNAAVVLRLFQEQFPAHREVFVTDQYGGVAAMTNRISDYSQADEVWWQAAWNGGEGSVFVDNKVTYDDSADAYVINMAVPVYDLDEQLIGVLRSTYDISALQNPVSAIQFGESGHALLLDQAGTILAGPGIDEIDRTLPQIVPLLAKPYNPDDGKLEIIANETNTKSVMAAVRLDTGGAQPAIDQLGWYLLIEEAENDALAPIDDALQGVMITVGVALALAAILAVLMAQTLTGPLRRLTQAAQRLSDTDDLSIRAPDKGRDEFGILGRTLNTMVARMQDLITHLEQRVRDRIRDLETVAEVSTQTAAILDVDQLLEAVVSLTKESFGLYHAHVYVLDPESEKLLLRAGAGDVGRMMVSQGHSIALANPRSVVARAGRTHEIVILDDVGHSADFLPNPLLPKTQSELAVALTDRGQLLGVLDVQSDAVGYFTPEMANVMEMLARQIAVALVDARLYEEATAAQEAIQKRAAELQTVAEVGADVTALIDPAVLLKNVADLTKERFDLYHTHIYLLDETGDRLVLAAGAGSVGDQMVASGHSIPLTAERSIVARAARTGQGTIENNVTQVKDFLPNPLLPRTRSEMATPLKVGGQVIGVLDVQSAQVNRFTDNDMQIHSTLAAQISAAINNARLFEETRAAEALIQKRATELQTVAEVGADVTALIDPAVLLKNVADLTKERFGLYHAHVYLLDETGEHLALAAGAGSAGDQMVASGHSIPLTAERSIVAYAARTAQAVVENNVMQAPGFLPNPLLPRTQAEMAIPLVVGEQVIGVLDVQSEQANHFTNNDVQIHSTLAAQISAAINNARLFEETRAAEAVIQKRATELQTVAEVGADVTALIDPAVLLKNVADLTKERFGLYHAHVYLLDETGEHLALAAGAGSVGDEMASAGHRIPLAAERSIVAYAARTAQAVVENDVMQAPGFLPNPLLPRTQAEMAIPLVVGEQVIGVLDVQSEQANHFTDNDVQIHSTLAAQISAAINNARLFEETRAAEALIQKRATELQTVAEVGADVTALIDPAVLLKNVADLTKERFGLYHAHIYLLDETGEQLALAAGAGSVGDEMASAGHRIPLAAKRSIVANAARTAQAVVENDVFQAPGFLPNPLLPRTQAEMAIPLMVGEQVIGVLDVQSEQANHFTDNDVQIHSTLAAQIATAINNARLFEETRTAEALIQKRATELQTVAEVGADVTALIDPAVLLKNVADLTKERFGLYHTHVYLLDEAGDRLVLAAGAGSAGDQMVASGHSILLTAERSIVARAARTAQAVVENDVIQAPGFLPNPLLPNTEAEMAIPLVVGEQVIGVLDVQSEQANHFTDNDVQIHSTLAAQIATAINNARLFEETRTAEALIQKRATELQTVAEVGADVTALIDPAVLLKNVADLTKERFGLYHAHVYLLDETGDRLVLAAGAGSVGDQMVASEHSIPLTAERSIVARAARTGQGTIENNVTQVKDFLPNPLLPLTRSEMATPLKVGGQVIGVLDVQSEQANHFTDNDVQIHSTLAAQIAAAINNARLFEETRAAEALIQKRATELQTVAEVGADVTALIDPAVLLKNVADLTKERFGLYHAHVYLLDETGEQLALAAGAGSVGDEMASAGHRIPLAAKRSIVANAARTAQAVVENDVFQAPGFLPNPLLPRTQAEMAIPLMVGEQVIGVLDVQSEQANHFTDNDVQIHSTLAAQIATAISNARLFEETRTAQALIQKRATELQTVAEVGADVTALIDPAVLLKNVADLTKERFGLYHAHVYLLDEAGERLVLAAGAGSVGDQMVASGHSIPLTAERSIVARAARTGEGVVENDVMQAPGFLPNPLLPNTEAEMAIPLVVGEQVIGVLDVQSEQANHFTDNDVQIHSTLAAQISAAINNARLFEETRAAEAVIQKRATELQTVAEVGADVTALIDPAVLLKNVADLTKERFGLYHTHVYLLDETGEQLVLAAGAGSVGDEMASAGHRIPLAAKRSIVANAARTAQSVVENDVMQAPGFLPNPLLPRTQAEMAIPLMVGERVIGVLDVQSAQANRFTSDDVQIQSTLAAQIATALNNARLFEETRAAEALIQKRATELQTVAEVSAEASTSLDIQELLLHVSELTKERFGLYHAHVYLLDKSGEYLVLAAGAGEQGQLMVSSGHRIRLASPISLVSRAARTRQAVVINDVIDEPSFLPNPMLPDTRSELAVPMIVGNRIIGVLDVQSEKPNRFDEVDIRVKTTLASAVAVAVRNAQLYTEVVEAAERLRELDRLKSEFLASMSHELRTPLNSIIGYAEVLLDGIDGDLSAEMEEDVSAIYGSGKHLLNLINDILDLAKIEAGQMDLIREEIDLIPFIEEIVNTSRVLLKGRPVEMLVDIDPTVPYVVADALRLRQVFSNLISNAIKFTESGNITVSAHPYSQDPSKVIFAVTDTGVGVTPENLPKIFERFRQVDQSHTRRVGGTGLGLSITRQLVELHGGSIWVESEFGVGSTFYFTLPTVVETSVKES